MGPNGSDQPRSVPIGADDLAGNEHPYDAYSLWKSELGKSEVD